LNALGRYREACVKQAQVLAEEDRRLAVRAGNLWDPSLDDDEPKGEPVATVEAPAARKRPARKRG
jgi:hypothetical protein